MSFNVDDPLAGILSDGSDDSFFDDDILGKKKPTKAKPFASGEKKSSLFDLEQTEKPADKPATALEGKKDTPFDFDKAFTDELRPQTSGKPLVSKDSIKFQSSDSKKTALDVNKSPAKTKGSTSADKLDFLNTPKKETKVLGKGKSSQSLLDDILGEPTTKAKDSIQSRPGTAAKGDFDLDTFLGKSDTKSAPNKNTQKQNTKPDKTKGELAPPKKKSSEDWLGIFQEEEDDNDNADAGMPSWLVGGDTKKKKKEKQPEKKQTPKEEVKEKVVEEKSEIEPEKDTVDANIPKMPQAVSVAINPVLQGSSEDITAEGAALYLQQQESQLMVAMQLKAQEEKLVAMQMRQKESQRVQREAALAHHEQLDAMLRKQSENRQQMQAIIAAHQERITQRIKALLSTQDVNSEDNNNPNENYENTGMETRETPHNRERKQLLQLVQSLQENHDKEIDLMETSYRRQLAFLEISLNQSEERMKEEGDKLVKFYTEKIGWLEEHHHLYKKLTEDNLTALTERHRAENEMLRQQHLDNVKILQEHYAALMENIKTAVKQEQVLIQDSAGFSSNLQELLIDVKENKSQCQLLVHKVHSLAENTQRDTEKNLQVRETQINEMIQQLKKERDNFETEKLENRELIKMLETRLKQMTSMIEEETSSLKQKKMEFEYEKATFNKQTEFAKNILKKQDEELTMLKEDFQREYQEKISKVDEEKSKIIKDSAAVAKEKASVINLKQELEKLKAELQAQLEEVSEERSKLNAEKQQMNMEEQRIMAKSRDLDLLAKTAIEKQSQADKKYSEAEFLQRKYEDRIRRIQEHVVSLNSREKQIAREKVALSRERLTLHNERKQIESRQQCSLCKSTQNAPYSFENYTFPESYLNVPVARDIKDGNVNSAMNAIEQEMAHLMSRNFNLRHNPVIANVGNEDRRLSNVNDLPSSEPMQMESGPFKEYMDPKFMMLRLDVQKVLSNLDQHKRDNVEDNAIEEE
ncbi:hypothetical protein O3G_MSEX003586 [Manduca sexta]|uniref:Fas-binding factor 1 C-terminal domain-containing protein n=1 Tax=Manduca sexta TaxID=7130 RepID=A0A922CG53_MANSE|nr:hypothetical protein O3G_MSEX003586 [Manduca sexta]